nr:GLUG motif-containing protein [Parabacteroides goldsteinii]
MRNKFQLIVRLLCLAAFLWMIPGGIHAEADVWDGTTKTQPNGWKKGDTELTISTATELAWVAETVNKNTETGSSGETGFEGCTIKLENDIDLNNQEWTPVGSGYSTFFKGTFDGNQHTIKNLKITSSYYIGLFGTINGATIKNVGVIISNDGIKSEEISGGIVGRMSGGTSSITNCFVTGGPISSSISSGYACAGGIIGVVEEGTLTINNCFTSILRISAIGENGAFAAAGGIMARNQGTVNIENCSCLNGSVIGTIGDAKAYINLILTIGNANVTNSYSCSLTPLITNTASGTQQLTIPTEGDKNGTFITAENKDKFLENLPDFGDLARTFVIEDYITPEGDGSSSSPFLLTSQMHLLWLATGINNNETGFIDKYYQLTQSINRTTECIPIGTTANPFKGTFDGNNQTVTLGIKTDSKQAQAGLFGTIDAGSTVKKVAVHVTPEGITSTANGAESKAGAIAAVNKGTIDQCYVTGEGSILSSDGTTRHAGGIAGDNSGVISNCYNLIPVKVNTISDSYLGGIAGYNTGTIEYCFATGKVQQTEGAVISSIADGMDNTITGGIVGFNAHENTGVVKNCLAVNAQIPTEAHRVIGTGGDADDANNFSFYEMPRPITKAAAVYDPLEGTPLTKDNLNSDAGGCFNGWDGSAWDMGNISTHLPKLKGYTAQPETAIASYLLYTIKLETSDNGTLSVTRPNPLGGGTAIIVNNNDQVPYNTVLTITATPANDQCTLDKLTANGSDINSGSNHIVTDNVTVKAIFSKNTPDPEPVPTPDPEPSPEPTPIYYKVSLPAVEGTVTDPVAGDYKVESWSSFRFYLTLNKEYDKSLPVVTTDRGETIIPRSSDGAYIIKYVRTDIQIFIDGIAKNPDPVANEKIEANHPKVWKTGNLLHIQAVTDEQGFIYTIEGKLQKICRLTTGKIETVQLPTGIYLIRIGKESFKVIL